MRPDESTGWDFTDGWVLMSIHLAAASGRTKIERVIAAADAMNHAILTYAETVGSLQKLVAAGIVEISGHEYSISAEHQLEIARAWAGRGGLFSSPDKGRRWLVRTKADHSAGAVSVGLSESEYEEACRRYSEKEY